MCLLQEINNGHLKIELAVLTTNSRHMGHQHNLKLQQKNIRLRTTTKVQSSLKT